MNRRTFVGVLTGLLIPGNLTKLLAQPAPGAIPDLYGPPIRQGDVWFATVLQADAPNRNGRIYPANVLKAAIDKFRNDPDDAWPSIRVTHPTPDKHANHCIIPGQCALDLEQLGDPYPVRLANLSHYTSDLRFESNHLTAIVRTLNCDKGRLIEDLLNKHQIAFRTTGIGNLEPDGVITDFKLTSIDAHLITKVA